MAGRVDKALREQLVATGQWESFKELRDSLKQKGYRPNDARVAALSELQASRGKGSEGATAVASRDDQALLTAAPAEVEGKSASEPEIVRWVARHVDHPNPDPNDCPDAFAWTLLRQCREVPGFTRTFIEKLWTKLIPSRSQLESDAEPEFDGKVTVDMVDRIRAMKARAEGEKATA